MDIFIHLLIGSEGTLAFIAGAEQNTVALRNYYSSTVLYFNGVDSAAAAVPALCDTPALSVEMMDYASLKSLGNRPSIPDLGNIKADATALLLDYGADTQEEMMHLTEQYMPLFEKLDGIATVTPFTKTVRERAELWYIRDGIFPCVAGARALGDNVILEDVAAPPEKLYNLVVGLQDLFHRDRKSVV